MTLDEKEQIKQQNTETVNEKSPTVSSLRILKPSMKEVQLFLLSKLNSFLKHSELPKPKQTSKLQNSRILLIP